MNRRSLPETPPTPFLAQQVDDDTPSMSPRSVSIVIMDDQDVYTDITEMSEESQVEQQHTSFSSWREAIASAGEDELRELVSKLVGTMENGLQPGERQSISNSPGYELYWYWLSRYRLLIC